MRAKTKLLGDPENVQNSIGPVVDRAQFDRIMSIIGTAQQEKQGTLVLGGKISGEKACGHRFHLR